MTQRQEKQPAGFEAGAAREIQEGVGGAAADFEKLAVVQSVGGIVRGKRGCVRRFAAGRAVAHPGENGFGFLLGRRVLGDDGVGETFEVLVNRMFPDSRVEGSDQGEGKESIGCPPKSAK
jgi:hypothetical protein